MFQHVQELNGKKNSKGSLYFISNQLPEGCNEVRRQLQAIVTENHKQLADARMKRKFINNNLVINNEVYHCQVSTPIPTDLLKVSSQLRTKMHTTDLKYGNTETHKASRFIGVTHAMMNIDDICEGYHKVKALYSDATHIMCVYRLHNSRGPFGQDGLDDGRHGSGYHMLLLPKEKNYENLAVYVVRYYGGLHFGPFHAFK